MQINPKNLGYSLVEVLVGLSITIGVLVLFAYLSTMGSLVRGGIEKKTESFQMANNLVSKLYNSTFNEIELMCQAKGVLGTSVTDPCIDSGGQLAVLTPFGPFVNPLLQYFDATINVTTMQNSGATSSATISCLHLNTCRYLIDSTLIEVQLSYHWLEPTVAGAQSRTVFFRRGVR